MSTSKKVRFVVGVFQSASGLMSVSEDLRSNGIAADDIVLLRSPGTLDSDLREAAGGILDGSIHWKDTTPPNGGAASVSVLKRQAASFEDWIAPPIARRLVDHLARGACLLFVSAPSSDHVRKIGEILLRDSADSVQSHEFSVMS